MIDKGSRLGYPLQIVLLSAVWGVAFLLIRIAVPTFPPFWLAFLRSAMGAAVLWTALPNGGRQMAPHRLLPWLLIVAIFNNVVPWTLFAVGEETIQSNTAALINATTPLWALLFTSLLGRSRVSVTALVGVALGFFGVGLVVFSPRTDASALLSTRQASVGALFIMMAAASYGFATVIAKRRLHGIDPLCLATAQLSIAALVLCPLALSGPLPASVTLGSAAAVVILGVLCSGVAYFLYYRLLAQVSATQVSAVTFLLPLWGIFWGSFANESMTAMAWAGVALTLSGILVLNLRPSRAAL